MRPYKVYTGNDARSRARQAILALVQSPFHIKYANSGPSQEGAFEQAFASLAHTFIADKAPKLLDYELGFQLLEKNDEGSRAVGVFGFKVGDDWIFAPMFFLRGQLKGHELLYLKNQDLFVPMKEAWINYLLGRRSVALGEGIDRNLSHIGVRGPNLHQLSKSPYKFASAIPSWKTLSKEMMIAYSHLSPKEAYKEKPISLRDFFKEAGVRYYREFLKFCQARPSLVEATDRFYPGLLEETAKHFSLEKRAANARYEMGELAKKYPIKIQGMVQEGEDALAGVGIQPPKAIAPPAIRERGLQQEKPPKGARRIRLKEVIEEKSKPSPLKRAGGIKQASAITKEAKVLREGGPDIRNLNQDKKNKLLRDRYVVQDDRDPDRIAFAYDVQTPLHFKNPSETGIYKVLVKPDVLEDCIILFHPYSSYNGRNHYCTVISKESKKWINVDSSQVWVDGEARKQDWIEYFDSLEEPSCEKDSFQVIVTRSGSSTTPFRIRESYDSCVAEVYFRDNYSRFHTASSDYTKIRRPFMDPPCCEQIRLTNKLGSKIHRMEDGELRIPADAKAISLKSSAHEKDHKDEDCCAYDSDPGPLHLGSLADVQVFLQEKTYPVKIISDGKEYTVKAKGEGKVLSKASAVEHLILDHDLNEAQTLELLKKADQHRSYECWVKPALIKRANPYLTDSAPSAPSIPDLPVGSSPLTDGKYPSNEPTGWRIPVADLASHLADREKQDPRSPDPQALQAVMQAVQSGEKEVFDVAVLSGMLKSVRDDSTIDRYLPDVMRGMNGLGRLLLSFYWHQDQFAERYGKADISNIEDGLRNAFESVGELFLTLKAKKVNPLLDEGLDDGQGLEDVAGL